LQSAKRSTRIRHWRIMSNMTLQTFRELLTQRPFRPFRLVMSSGQTHEVRHPEMAMLTRSDILVGVGETDEGVPAEFRICSLLHVTSIEPLSAATTGSTK
jgi:hypothetical protein